MTSRNTSRYVSKEKPSHLFKGYAMATITIGNIIKIFNAYSSKDIKAEEITMFNFLEKITAIMKKRGAYYCYLSMHKTNLQKNPFSPSGPMSKMQESENSYIFIVDLAESYFLNPSINEDGSTLRIGNIPAYVNGKYLILLVFSTDKDHASKIAPQISSRLINTIRIVYGIKAADQPVHQCYFDKIENTVSVNSNGFRVYLTGENPKDDLSALDNFEIVEINNFLLSPDADTLLNRALREMDPETRFLFLWLCFESMVPGQERRNLFEVELSSAINNAEVLRLFNLRCELTHEGRSSITALDCLSVIWAIRIAICPAKGIQESMSKRYEDWILENKFILPDVPKERRLEAYFNKDSDIFNKLVDIKKHYGKDNSTVIYDAINYLWENTFNDK